MVLYDTRARKKRPFTPVHPGEVRMYVCGPTVYNFFHLGNARPFVVFDMLRRYLEYKGYRVTLVQNFTDVDDKMIRRAAEDGVTVKELGDRFIAEYDRDAASLGIRPATIRPRATEHMPEMIALVQTLLDKGLAYEAHGDVYFDTQADAGYGRLSGQSLEDLDAGARIGVDEDKHNPMDFALWKAAKPGEPAWESPWGPGRPGWHLECSAMAMKYLGETLDIHAGGADLVFPHHENEAAQSEGATGKPFANYWIHCGYINVDNQKMSKSAGNFFMVRDIAKEYDLESVRMFLLSSHYRSPVNFSRAMIEQSRASLERLYNARDGWNFLLNAASERENTPEEDALLRRLDALCDAFERAMDDDFNTAEAIGALFEMVREGNAAFNGDSSAGALRGALERLLRYADLLGLLTQEQGIDADAQAIAEARVAARASKNWAESDRLRDVLKGMGYVVEDTKQGQRITRA